MNNKVIILGEDGYNTLGVIRSFGKMGISSFLLLISPKKKGYILKSRYLNEIKIVVNYEAALIFLTTEFIKEKCSPIIITTSDTAASIIDLHRNELKDYFILSYAGKEDGNIVGLMDKEKMGKLAINSGFNVPKTWHLLNTSEIKEKMKFPCIVKPLKSIEGSKQDIKICKEKKDLETILHNSNFITKPLLIQQFIETDYEILIIGCRFMSNGKVSIPGLFKRFRTYPYPGGASSFGLITTDVKKYIDVTYVTNLLVESDYYGLFSIEFGMCKDTLYFFEINYRNDGTSHYFDKAGINLPYLWALDAAGEKIDNLLHFPSISYYFIDEIGDFLNAFERRISYKQWFKDFRKAQVFMYYDKKDKKPFFSILSVRLCWVIYRMLKWIFRNVRK